MPISTPRSSQCNANWEFQYQGQDQHQIKPMHHLSDSLVFNLEPCPSTQVLFLIDSNFVQSVRTLFNRLRLCSIDSDFVQTVETYLNAQQGRPFERVSSDVSDGDDDSQISRGMFQNAIHEVVVAANHHRHVG